jgi:hypothetical protein
LSSAFGMVTLQMIDCTLVTCEKVPKLDPDDRVLLHELRARGLAVSIEIWSDPAVDWSDSRLCLLRSTWDYYGRYEDFIAWIERVASVTSIRNDCSLVKWNAHKSYIRELELLGIPVVPTSLLPQAQEQNVMELSKERGWSDIVIKPARGAAAHDVMLVRGDTASLAVGQAHFDLLAITQDVLIQPYLDSVVTYGERSLVFFNACYSHAITKKPFDTLLVVSNAPSTRVDATDDEIAVAMRALRAIPSSPLYARVDLLRDRDGVMLISEVELIEPGLYLAIHEPAPRMFADAIERELGIVCNAVEVEVNQAHGTIQ